MIPTASVLQGHEKECGDFAEMTAFERYGVKTSEKANMHNQHWLTSSDGQMQPLGPPAAPSVISAAPVTARGTIILN